MDLPNHMGIGRSCRHLKVLMSTTLDDSRTRRVYYCRASMHSTTGTFDCNSYEEKERTEK